MVPMLFFLFPIPSDRKVFPWGEGNQNKTPPSHPTTYFGCLRVNILRLPVARLPVLLALRRTKAIASPFSFHQLAETCWVSAAVLIAGADSALVQLPKWWDLSQLHLVKDFHDAFNINILKHTYILSYMIRQAIELRTSKSALPKA